MWPSDVPSRERWHVLGAMAAGVLAVLLYVLTTRSHALAGDELFYDESARFWADGDFWWSTTPFGEPHPSAWKPPLYPALVGTLYAIVGEDADRVAIVQSLFAAVTVGLTWLFARRLFGPTAAVAAAWVVALFPLAFEYYGLLFPEALAVPLTLFAISMFVEREPTPKRALAVGAVIGLCLLVRPTSAFLFFGVLAAFIVATGWRRGAVLTAVTVVAAVVVVSPWTIRNYVEHDGLIPISVQDGAVYGTFNQESADDNFTWRAILKDPPEFLRNVEQEDSEADLRSDMVSFARDNIKDNPEWVPQAFFWNGIVRFWDLRSPSSAIDEVKFQGRSEAFRWVGLFMYYVLVVLAALALWRLRDRRAFVIPVLALAVGASIVFSVLGGTRYRAPLEPLLVIVAASLVASATTRPSRPLP